MSEEEEISQNDDNIKKRIKANESSNAMEESDQNDVMEKVNKEGKKLKKVINSNNIKVFEKYQNLSIKELHKLLTEKNNDLIKLNEEKEKSKKILNELISKLNNTIKNNTDFLYDEEIDADLILNLEKIKEDKKKQLDNSKKINNLFKSQLSSIKSKIASSEKEKKKMNLIDTKIDTLKKKNIFLKKEINEIKNKKIIQEKELEIISDNKKYPLKIKLKTEEMNNFSSQKHDYFVKLSLSMKSLDNIIKEIKRFDEMYNSSIKEDTDESVVKKINFWMNLIKGDLSGEKNEILNRIETGKSKFLNEIKSIKDNLNLYSNYNYNYNYNTLTNTNSANSVNINNVNTNTNANTEESLPKKINTENDSYTHTHAYKSNEKIKNKIIINKNKSSSLLYSNYNKNGSSLKRNQIPSLYISANSSGNDLDTKKTLFKKLNYLKVNNTNGNGNIKLRLKNISNKNKNKNKYKGNNYFISEEINESGEMNNDNNYNNYNYNNDNDMDYIESNPNNNNNIKFNKELNNILLSDYNEISDSDYRELLSKKEQYLESNLRLEKNIIEIKRTKSKKISHIINFMKQNEKNLENIKLHNSLIEKEINNLCKVFQLTVEQAKIKSELDQKKKSKIKLKLKNETVKNEENKLENKLIKSSDKIPNSNKIAKKRNYEDILIPNKRQIRSIEIKSSKKKNKKETRDEQLKMIKEKYKDENNFLNEDENNHMKEVEKEHNEKRYLYEYNNINNSNSKSNKDNNNEEQKPNNEKVNENNNDNDINNGEINININKMEEENKNKEKNEENFEVEPL